MVAARCPYCFSMFSFSWPSDDDLDDDLDNDVDADKPLRIKCLWCRNVFDPYAKHPPGGDSQHVGIDEFKGSNGPTADARGRSIVKRNEGERSR
ncbi:MAG: hypothetical protein JNL90_10665 [Planctomycetes bacterium]|nr:hypothetical protein [Planctomycetota bacterium]